MKMLDVEPSARRENHRTKIKPVRIDKTSFPEEDYQRDEDVTRSVLRSKSGTHWMPSEPPTYI